MKDNSGSIINKYSAGTWCNREPANIFLPDHYPTHTNNISFNPLLFGNFLKPVVNPDPTVKAEITGGKIVVKYKNPKTGSIDNINVNNTSVEIEKRDCKAYDNVFEAKPRAVTYGDKTFNRYYLKGTGTYTAAKNNDKIGFISRTNIKKFFTSAFGATPYDMVIGDFKNLTEAQKTISVMTNLNNTNITVTMPDGATRSAFKTVKDDFGITTTTFTISILKEAVGDVVVTFSNGDKVKIPVKVYGTNFFSAKNASGSYDPETHIYTYNGTNPNGVVDFYNAATDRKITRYEVSYRDERQKLFEDKKYTDDYNSWETKKEKYEKDVKAYEDAWDEYDAKYEVWSSSPNANYSNQPSKPTVTFPTNDPGSAPDSSLPIYYSTYSYKELFPVKFPSFPTSQARISLQKSTPYGMSTPNPPLSDSYAVQKWYYDSPVGIEDTISVSGYVCTIYLYFINPVTGEEDCHPIYVARSVN